MLQKTKYYHPSNHDFNIKNRDTQKLIAPSGGSQASEMRPM